VARMQHAELPRHALFCRSIPVRMSGAESAAQAVNAEVKDGCMRRERYRVVACGTHPR